MSDVDPDSQAEAAWESGYAQGWADAIQEFMRRTAETLDHASRDMDQVANDLTASPGVTRS